MGAYARLHVPVVQLWPGVKNHRVPRLGSLKDRWCVALKPPGFAGAAAPPLPSLETTLKALLPADRPLKGLSQSRALR